MSPQPKKFPGYFTPPLISDLPFDMAEGSQYPWFMRCKSPILWTASLALVAVLFPLQAQDSALSADDMFIRDAQTARNPASLETRASTLEGEYQYDAAVKLMEGALTLR